MKEAMIAKDSLRLNVLRGLISSFTNELVAKKEKPDGELSDQDALSVISKAVKQRKDSIEQFEKGGREDLAESERAELLILEKFLPAQMSRDEIKEFVSQKLASSQDIDKSKIGVFVGSIMKELKGKADGSLVKEVIEELVA